MKLTNLFTKEAKTTEMKNKETIITSRNEFRVSGRVVAMTETNDGLFRITVAGKNGTKDVYPEVYCTADMIPECKEHAALEVTGYIKNDGYIKDGEQTYYPRLYAKQITIASALLFEEFGVQGRFREVKPCMAYLSGQIEEIVVDEVKEDVVYYRYYIKTAAPNGDTTVRIDWKKIDRHPELAVGDNVCAVCKISTPRKEIGTNIRNFLNLDVFDMDKMDSNF